MPKYKVGSDTFDIPDNPKAIAAFLKKYPNAVKVSAKQEMLDKIVASQAATKTEPKSGVEKRIEKAADQYEYSVAEDTGERLPFNKDVAGKGDGTVDLDIKPWYGDQMKTNYTPEQWNEFVKSTGFKPTVKNTSKDPKAQVKEFQYYLAHHPDWKGSIDELHGKTDKGFGTPTKSKKKYDGYLGRRWDLLIEKKPEVKPETKPVEDKTITKKDEVVTEGERPDIERNTPTNYQLPQNAPWWLQDIIKTAGAATDLARIKRYQPWQATPQFRLPEATFYDPTRELAANAEQANLAYQAQQAFTNPQQLAAASAVTQGQAAKNAADIMSRYNNLNVGLANQLEGQRTDIMNAASQNKANLDTQLWDKYTLLNQQFDNSKAQARQNLRQSYIDAVTNKANTYNLNQLYPQYAVDPSRGGQLYFRPDPNKIQATNKYDKYKEIWNKAKQFSNDPETQKYLFNAMVKGGEDETNDNDIRAAATRGWRDSSNKEE